MISYQSDLVGITADLEPRTLIKIKPTIQSPRKPKGKCSISQSKGKGNVGPFHEARGIIRPNGILDLDPNSAGSAGQMLEGFYF